MNVVYKHLAVVDLQRTQEYIETKLVFYEITDEDTLTVLRVLDGRQDYLSILFG